MSINDRVKHRPLVIEEERINFDAGGKAPEEGRPAAGTALPEKEPLNTVDFGEMPGKSALREKTE
jgi:hypothetical protein